MKSNFLSKYLPLLLVLLSTIFGLIGLVIYYNSHAITYHYTDLIYAVTRLYIFESDFTLNQVNIFLNIARFLAPLSLATAIVKWLLNNFSHQINRQKVKLFKRHIVVFGDAERNKLLIQDITKNKKKDYIFAKNENSEENNKGFNIINYQAVNSDLLQDILLYKAKYLIISFQNDIESLNFTNKLLDIIQLDKINQNLEIIILFSNPQWAELSNDMGMLESISHKTKQNKYLNVRYLNYIDKAIRKHMLNYAPDIIKPITNITDPTLAIGVIGNNIIMQRLLINLALNSHYLNHKKLKVYISNHSNREFASFVTKYQLDKTLEIIDVEMLDIYEVKDITALYICENDELLLMHHIKEIQESEFLSELQRFIFIDQSNDISSLLPSHQNKIIDISKEVGIFNNIIDESLDDLAKTIHEDYIAELIRGKKLKANKETHQEWSLLPDEIKDRNRMQADHMGIKVRSLGCKIVTNNDIGEPYDWDNDSRIEALSKAEHNRWNAYMYYKGWKEREEKNERKKTHPDMIVYEKLEDYIKQYDRNTVLNIPTLVKQMGNKIVKIDS